MSKRTTKLFLFLVALLCPVISWAQQETVTDGGVIYTFVDDHFEVTGYDADWDSEELHVRSYYSSVYVTKIRANAFSGIESIKRIRLDINRPTEFQIEDDAFAGIGSENNHVDISLSPCQFEYYGGNLESGYLKGGYFDLIRLDDISGGCLVTYRWMGDSYIVADPIYVNPGALSYEEGMHIWTEFKDWDENSQEYVITTVSQIKKSAFDNLRSLNISELFSKFLFRGSNHTDIIIEDGAFEGVGSDENPMDLWVSDFTSNKASGPLPFCKAHNAEFNDGVITICGGKFKCTSSSGFVTYLLNGDESIAIGYNEALLANEIANNENNVALNLLYSPYWSYDENGIGVRTDKVAVRDGAFEGIHGITRVQLPENFIIGENAFVGIGETTPVKLTINANKAKALGGAFNAGVFNLAGGRFSIVKELYSTNYLDLTYTYNEDSEGNGEYILTKADVSPDLSESITDYKLVIQHYFDEEFDADGNLISYVPVTTIKADAISVEAKSKIKDVFVHNGEGYYLKNVEDGAFDGMGTEASPMPLEVGYPVLFGRSVGAEFNDDGVATIGGGYFKITRQEGFIVYQLKGDEYYAVGYDQESIDDIYNNLPEDYDTEADVDARLKFAILPSLYEEDAEGSYSFKVKGIKAGAFAGVNHISHVRIEANDQTIGDGAFEGVGSTENPMPLIADFPVQFAKNHNLVFEDGVTTIGGGKFQIKLDSDPIIYQLNGDGEEYSYSACGFYQAGIDIRYNGEYELQIPQSIYEDSENGEGINIKVASIVAGAFAGIRGIIGLRIDADELTIGENAFSGIGADEPLPLNMDLAKLNSLGGTITDGVIDLAGGKFILTEMEATGGLCIVYAYSEDDEGNAEYVVHKVEKLSDEGSHQLSIRTTFKEERDENWKLISFIPVTGIKANAIADDVKASIKSVYISNRSGCYLDVEKLNDALEGIGSDDNPLPLEAYDVTELVEKLNLACQDGVVTLAGGKFAIQRSEYVNGLHVVYTYNQNPEGQPEYILTSVEKLEDLDSYQLQVSTSIYNYADGSSTPVTAIRANAISEEVKPLISSIYVNNGQGNFITDATGAFEGLGTQEEPLTLMGEYPIGFANALGATFENGVAQLCGGYFQIMKEEYYINNRATYLYNGDSYVLSKISPDSDDNVNIELTTSLEERDGDTWVNYPVVSIKSGAFADVQNVKSITINGDYLQSVAEDAFVGIGTSVEPVMLNVSLVVLERLSPETAENGVKIAGGYFEITRKDGWNGLNTIYKWLGESYEVKGYDYEYFDENAEYTLRILTQFEDYNEEDDTKKVTPVTRIPANVFKGVTNVKQIFIEGKVDLDNFEIDDEAFVGVGDIDVPATITTESPSFFKSLMDRATPVNDDNVDDNVYNICGGVFKVDALTIYVEQNPDELAYRIYGDADHEGISAPITEGYEEMKKTVVIDNSTYYTFTVLNPGTIRRLYIQNDRGEMFDRDDLEITGDAYLKWDNQQKRLMLEGAPIDYGFRVNSVLVTEANAEDVFRDDETNAGKVSYDAVSNMLILNGVDIHTWGTFLYNQYNDGLYVELRGENNISPYSDNYSISFLETRKKLKITGGGVLNFTTAQNGNGISAWDNQNGQDDQQPLSVNISNVTLNINGGEWGIDAHGGCTVNISNANINISNVTMGAIRADELNFDGVRYETPADAIFVDGEVREADGETIAKTVVIAPIPPIVILDELATEEPAGEEGIVDVVLQYTFHAGWNAICLPFDISEETLIEKFGEGVKVAVMESQELTDNVATINFAQADGLMANVPSLLYISAVPTDVLSFTNVSLALGASTTVSGTAFDFVGTTTQGTVNAGDYILVNGTMTKAAGGNTINAYRAYLMCNGLAGARTVKLSIEGEDGTTTISEIAQGAVQGEPIYNLSGVRQNGTVRNGLYIQGGKLIIKNSSKK